MVKNAFVWALNFIIQDLRSQDESKSICHDCLLHLISLRGLDVKINAKTVFKT